jgi:hypothetical protein
VTSIVVIVLWFQQPSPASFANQPSNWPGSSPLDAFASRPTQQDLYIKKVKCKNFRSFIGNEDAPRLPTSLGITTMKKTPITKKIPIGLDSNDPKFTPSRGCKNTHKSSYEKHLKT